MASVFRDGDVIEYRNLEGAEGGGGGGATFPQTALAANAATDLIGISNWENLPFDTVLANPLFTTTAGKTVFTCQAAGVYHITFAGEIWSNGDNQQVVGSRLLYNDEEPDGTNGNLDAFNSVLSNAIPSIYTHTLTAVWTFAEGATLTMQTRNTVENQEHINFHLIVYRIA